jgi:hypothetical protein
MYTDGGMAEHVLMDAIVLGLCRGVIDCGNGGVYGNDVEPIACQFRNHRQPHSVVKVRRGRVQIPYLRRGCVVDRRQRIDDGGFKRPDRRSIERQAPIASRIDARIYDLVG